MHQVFYSFENGSTMDKPKSGRPRLSRTNEHVDCLNNSVRDDQHISIRKGASALICSIFYTQLWNCTSMKSSWCKNKNRRIKVKGLISLTMWQSAFQHSTTSWNRIRLICTSTDMWTSRIVVTLPQRIRKGSIRNSFIHLKCLYGLRDRQHE